MQYYFDRIINKIEKGRFELLGKGSGRYVYDLYDGNVIKIAYNKRGYAQNQVEHAIWNNSNSSFFAKVIGISNDYRCLVMEKAPMIKSMKNVWEYFKVKSNNELLRKSEFIFLHKNYKLMLDDFRRPNNWGLKNEIPIIIDYGFTREVYKKYYKR